ADEVEAQMLQPAEHVGHVEQTGDERPVDSLLVHDDPLEDVAHRRGAARAAEHVAHGVGADDDAAEDVDDRLDRGHGDYGRARPTPGMFAGSATKRTVNGFGPTPSVIDPSVTRSSLPTTVAASPGGRAGPTAVAIVFSSPAASVGSRAARLAAGSAAHASSSA